MNTAHTLLRDALRADIMRLEGFRPQSWANHADLGPLQETFPNGFPKGALHEFFASQPESLAATLGFLSGLLAITHKSGCILWVSANRKVFPPALQTFGLDPGRIIFADLKSERQIPWAIEEALKCTGITAVVGEMKALDFLTSRRFQLAAERTQLSGFFLRTGLVNKEPTACVTRWNVEAMNSITIQDESGVLPGIGFPKWKVELLRMRNGSPNTWELQWSQQQFIDASSQPEFIQQQVIAS
ncbi:MAG: Error-prone repair protein ImuA [Cyclobacteriaceae bacterium]|nr:Error-prone repair protein ImuA [Cyclobacteriaceae bacterium]